MRVERLMETPAGRDEHGTPSEDIVEGGDCGVLHREGGAHRCTDGWTDGGDA